MDNIPERIYLQLETDDGITWCADRINDTDIEYIRPDTQLIQSIEHLLKLTEFGYGHTHAGPDVKCAICDARDKVMNLLTTGAG